MVASNRAALVPSLGDWRRAQQLTGFLLLKRAQMRNIPYIKWAYKTTNVSHLISKIRKVMRPWPELPDLVKIKLFKRHNSCKYIPFLPKLCASIWEFMVIVYYNSSTRGTEWFFAGNDIEIVRFGYHPNHICKVLIWNMYIISKGTCPGLLRYWKASFNIDCDQYTPAGSVELTIQGIGWRSQKMQLHVGNETYLSKWPYHIHLLDIILS